MSGDTHAHALPNRNGDLDRLVHVGLVGLIFRTNGIKPNLLMGLAVFLTAALVGYMWDVAHLLY